MTLPNQLTILRLFLTGVFVIARESGMAWGATVAAIAFGLAVLSDYLDGVLARRLGCETDFGRLMDPLADKVLIAAALVCLAWSHDIPAWAAIILISRDFLITGLRQLALSHGTVLAVANHLGLEAVGVELSPKRARKARNLTWEVLEAAEAS